MTVAQLQDEEHVVQSSHHLHSSNRNVWEGVLNSSTSHIHLHDRSRSSPPLDSPTESNKLWMNLVNRLERSRSEGTQAQVVTVSCPCRSLEDDLQAGRLFSLIKIED